MSFMESRENGKGYKVMNFLYLVFEQLVDKPLLKVFRYITERIQRTVRIDCFTLAMFLLFPYLVSVGFEAYNFYHVGHVLFLGFGIIYLALRVVVILKIEENHHVGVENAEENPGLKNPAQFHLLPSRFLSFVWLWIVNVFMSLFLTYAYEVVGSNEWSLLQRHYQAHGYWWGLVATLLQTVILYLISCTPLPPKKKQSEAREPIPEVL